MWVERRPAEEDLRERGGVDRGEEVSEIWGCQMVESFIGEDQEFGMVPVGDGESVEVFEDWVMWCQDLV